MRYFKYIFITVSLIQAYLFFVTPFLFNKFDYSKDFKKNKFAELATDTVQIKEKLKPKTEKLYMGSMTKAPYGICYVHGFLSSRRELEPVVSDLAKKLNANVFFTRLSGHGSEDLSHIKSVKAQDWINDTLQCFEVASRIGSKVVVIGSGLGASLSLLTTHFAKYNVHTLVLLSPQIGIKDIRASLLAGFWGDRIADLAFGELKTFKESTPLIEEIWSKSYPAGLLKPLTVVSMSIKETNFENFKTSVYLALSKKNEALNFESIDKVYVQFKGNKRFDADSRYLGPVIAGEALNSAGTEPLLKNLYNFIKANN